MKGDQLAGPLAPVARGSKKGRQRGRFGSLRGNIPTWAGSLFAFRVLQRMQEQTTFSQVVLPPLSRGMTWSRLRSRDSKHFPQY